MHSEIITYQCFDELHQGSSLALKLFKQRIHHEWTVESGVELPLFERTVEAVSDTLVDLYTHEASYPIHEALNWKLTRFGHQARATEYAALILNDDGSVWQAKLSHPRLDRDKGKQRKYERPKGSSSRAWLAKDLPLHLWQQIARRSGVPLTDADQQLGFRTWLINYPQVPIIICEGAKKAACLLSLGYAALALPGIFNGYKKETQSLIDDLQQLAAPGRTIYICFDRDLKPKTIENVNKATRRLGKLFARAGCLVKVIQLPGPEKGIDDFVVAQGSPAFSQLYESAVALDLFCSSKLWELTYKPALTLNQRYLGDLPFPNSGFAFIKSPKGTGKTKALERLILEATRSGRKVLVITHRIQLGRAICAGLGIDWVEEMRQSETQGLLGYGLCIDSLHPDSQARFHPQDWNGAIVVFDEVEQIIWHVLNSNTCYEKRVKILENLKELLQLVASTGGLVIGQDADLSDISINYLLGLAEVRVEPWVVVNEWKPEHGWDVLFYDTPNPAPLVAQMQSVIETGPVFICLDSQKPKSRWSSINLEAYLKGQFPDKQILRIDSESVSDPSHPAYGIVERLDEVAANFNIIIATPTIGTGVSIDIRGYFVAVFGIFQGATPDAESRQALARVRDPVPRYVWARPFGPGKIGNGSCSYWDVAKSTTQGIRYNLQLLRDFDFDLDAAYDPITLRTWAKMAARVNTSLWDFREQLSQGLADEGHQVTVLGPDNALNGKHIKDAVVNIQESHKQAEAQKVASATDTTETGYLALKDKRAKSPEDRYTERKYVLSQRYGVEVTPALKLKDDDGWYAKIRLHYYLLNDIEFVQQRDKRELTEHLERGGSRIALQDVRLLGAQVQALLSLGIPELLNPTLEIKSNDFLVQTIARMATLYRADLKTVLNLTVHEQISAIQIVQALLEKLGLKLKCLRQERLPDKSRVRVYQYVPPDDGREAVFAVWRQRDIEAQARAAANAVAHPPIVIK